jgi:hypothetical protein
MPSPTLNKRQWLAIGAALVALIVVIVIAVVAGGGDDDASATATTAAAGSTVVSTPGTTAVTGTTSAGATTPTTQPADTATADGSTASTVASTAPGPTSPPTTGVPPSPTSLVTVPDGTIPVNDPIDTDEVGDFGTGVTAEIVRIEAVDGVAELPGEISGPALRITVRLNNGTDAPLVLPRVQVDVNAGADRAPGLALTEPGGAPFTGELAPGESADGVYVYGVPLDRRDQVQVLVLYSVEAPIVVFEGPAPTA